MMESKKFYDNSVDRYFTGYKYVQTAECEKEINEMSSTEVTFFYSKTGKRTMLFLTYYQDVHDGVWIYIDVHGYPETFRESETWVGKKEKANTPAPVPKEAEYEDTGITVSNRSDNSANVMVYREGFTDVLPKGYFPDLKEGEAIKLYRHTKGDDKDRTNE
jgi:hypothetical protein